jgi:hypothetical protein
MSKWEAEIEGDLAWRESEMGTLKLLLAASPNRSDRQRALLRACSAMLYAHYEGFCKFCWTILLDSIQKQSPVRSDLIESLAKRAMEGVFKKLRGDTSIENLWRFCSKDFATELGKNATFTEGVDTKSNLWPNLSIEINASVGIACPLLLAHSDRIGQLVGRRNKIAHGEKLEIPNMTKFQELEHAAVLVMHELAIAVVTCLDECDYLSQTATPAVATPLPPP